MSLCIHQDEIAQLKKQLEKLRRFQRLGDLEDSHGRRSLRMNLANEDELQPEIPITLVFTVRYFLSCAILTYYFVMEQAMYLVVVPIDPFKYYLLTLFLLFPQT